MKYDSTSDYGYDPAVNIGTLSVCVAARYNIFQQNHLIAH